MKKLLLVPAILALGFAGAQNYYGSEFVGESGVNNPLNLSKANGKIVVSGFIGGGLTGNFPISFKGGNADGTLTQLSPVDGKIEWIKQFGGGADEAVINTAIDATGNYYLTGYFNGAGGLSMDADPGPGVHLLSVVSGTANRDIFIIKLDPNGDFLWAKQMSSPSGGGHDDVMAIELDSAGNIYLAGSYVFIDFDPGEGSQIYTATGNSDGFVVKLDPNGNFSWVKTFEGTSSKKVQDMKIDSEDNIYVAGRFQGTIDLNPDATVTDLRTTAGNADTFVAKLTSSGDYVWGHSYGGAGADSPEKIAINNDKVYVSGSFSQTVDFDPTAGTNSHTVAGGAGSDGYFSTFKTDGTYVSSYVIPGTTSNGDTVKDILVDNSGNIFLAGLFQNITIGGNTYSAAAANSDAYYIKLDPSMNFSGIYLIQGPQNQNIPRLVDLSGTKFIASGASKGITAFDYTKPTVFEDPSSAQYYTYYTKFDFETTTLSTTEQSLKSKFSIYPNPVVNDVNLKSTDVINAVSIFNMEGRKVYGKSGIDIKNLNVSMLPNGTYILQSTDAKGNTQQTKMIKK